MATSLKKLVAFRQLGLVTDMDGTISPIVTHPEAAQVTKRNRELLRELSEILPLVAVISGRRVADVAARVGLPGVIYIGNHGLETLVDGEVQVLPEAQPFRANLLKGMQSLSHILLPGMVIEDKGVTCSIHYRQAAHPEEVKVRWTPVIEEIAMRNGLHFFPGRRVFELRPPVEVNKGDAFRHLVAKHLLEAAVFLGDDVTDVAALQAANQLRGEGKCYALGMGVFSKGAPFVLRTASDILASGVEDVEDFLAWLLSARKASST